MTPTPTFDPKGYFESAALPLHPTPDGVEGKLVLYQDRALKGRKQTAHEEPQDLSYNPTPGPDFKDAYLVVRSSKGVPLDYAEFSPWTSVEKRTDLTGTDNPVYLVTNDMDNGNPLIMGPITNLMVVQVGRLVALDCKNAKTGERETINLNKCQSGWWKMTPSRKGNGREIWEVWCEHYAVEDPPWTYYRRYEFDHGEWIFHESKVHQDWNSYDDDFPAASFFKDREK